ncbi:hypothetical protein E2C01_035077 [Portunus trituberculatus]|uniref:Uncharacterized protein n=1 Tax=Portunus trituberculatus TaxID=210409 RepID=A0A5B7FAH4_PORTR|nr:hypothetical protein [Portunus trituberculatus]
MEVRRLMATVVTILISNVETLKVLKVRRKSVLEYSLETLVQCASSLPTTTATTTITTTTTTLLKLNFD